MSKISLMFLLMSYCVSAQIPKTIFLDNEMEEVSCDYASYYQVNFVLSDNNRQGLTRTFYITGEKYIEGVYVNGRKQGEFKYFSPNAILKKTENYFKGRLVDSYTEWYLVVSSNNEGKNRFINTPIVSLPPM